MADLVTRLRLDDKQFNDNIRKSRAEIEKFKKSGDVGKQGISTLLTSFKGMAAGVTIASTAIAVFQTAVNSSASSQEKMAHVTDTAKTSVNEFFNSIKSGDWSFFKDGIIEAIKLAGDYQKAMKAIKQGTPLFNAYKDYKDAKLDNLNNRIENPNATKEEREQAWKEYQDVYRDQLSTTSQAERGLKDKLRTVASKAGINLKTDKDFENLFKANTATASGLVYSSSLYDRYKELVEGGWDKPIDEESFFKREKELGYSGTYEGEHSDYAQKRINAPAEIKAIEDYHPDVIMLYKLKKHLNEEEMQAINDAISNLSGVRSNFESRTTEFNDLSTKFDESGKYIGDDKKKVTSRSADLEKERKEAEEAKKQAELEKEQALQEGIRQILQNRDDFEQNAILNGKLFKEITSYPPHLDKNGNQINGEFHIPSSLKDSYEKTISISDLLQQELMHIIEDTFDLESEKGSKNWYNDIITKLESEKNDLTDSSDYQKIQDIINQFTYDRDKKFTNAQQFSIQDVEALLSKYEDLLKTTATDSPEFSKWKSHYLTVKNVLESMRKQAFDSDEATFEDGSINDLKSKLSEKQDLLLTLNPELNQDTIKDLKKEIKELKDEIESKEIMLGIKLPKDLGKEALVAFESSLSRVNSLVQMFSHSWDDMSGFEKFIQSTSALITIIDTVTTLQSTWNTFSEFLTAMFAKKQAETIADATTTATAEAEKTTAVVASQAAQTTATVTGSAVRTAALKTEMAAGSAAAYAYMPFVGVGLAAGQIAQFEAMILAASAVPTFADGGIFQSPLTTGDRNLARLNGGEMILNTGQQSNLFKLLDNGVSMSTNGQVEFKIRGQELVGILHNYNNKINKLR